MMTSAVWGKIRGLLWALFFLALPVTSFPYFPGFMGSSVLVRPLALYPLLVLMVLVTLPVLFTKRLPHTLIPFILFVLAALISTAYAFTRGILPPIDLSVSGRALRTLATLGLGGIFYLTVSLVPGKRDDLRFTLTWLYAGFGVALLWASFQIIYVLKFDQTYFDFLSELQKLVSIRKLFDKRISGMTYEPSWFAEQLTFVLMPWLFASVLSNQSVFRWRYRRLTVETVLLGWSALALLFTYSRGGLALFAILLSVSMGISFWRMYKRKDNRRPIFWRIILLVSLGLLLLSLVVFSAAQNNNYFSRLWGYWTDDESEGTYFEYIAFSQRFAYWETAYRIFEDYPLLGIGLGNFTFYFDPYLADRPIRDSELLSKLVPEEGRNQVVTVKNYLVRIMAETGILGTSLFVTFLVALSGCVVYLLLSPDPLGHFWGLGGLLGLIAFAVVSLSVDSFAIPNGWVMFGLITAGAHIFNQATQKAAG